MRWSWSVLVVVLGCQRNDAPMKTTAPTASAAPDAAVALIPLTSSVPVAPSASTPLPPLEPVKPAVVVAKSTHAAAKRDPMRACCSALRKQSQLESAQAAALCDSVVAALDDSAGTPQLEQMLRPVLVGAPLPNACKGL